MFKNMKYGNSGMQLLLSWAGWTLLLTLPIIGVAEVLHIVLINPAVVFCASAIVVLIRNHNKINNYLKNIEEIKKEVPEVTLDFYEKINGTIDGFDELYEDTLGMFNVDVIDQNYEYEIVHESLTWAVQNILLDNFKKKHLVQLRRDYKRLIATDEYGISNTTNWDKKLRQIVTSIIIDNYYVELQNVFDNFKSIDGLHVNYDEKEVCIKSMVGLLSLSIEHEERIDSIYRENIELDYKIEITPEMTGLDYEHEIAHLVNKNNEHWAATVTQGSGDQGLDVMLQSKVFDFQIAVQCKLYNSPVGNKAVQEVNAAHLFYNTNLACVVTNNSFTKSAHELALATNVMLLHHDSLLEWLEEISNELQISA